jgi:histidinol phosphatase-like enzyme (inositol monophosphatase family)
MVRETINLGELLEVSQEWAQLAGAVTLRHFGGVVASETKGDGTPVTVADRAAEAFLRERIRDRYPTHGVLGEEYGEENPGAWVRWILDPIDGTKSFMRGVPLYGVLIGIETGGEPAVGVAHFPVLGETVAAAMGEGCFWNGGPARVSSVSSLANSAILTSDPRVLLDGPMAEGWEALTRSSALARSWGDCYGHMLVATGRAEVMVDPILSPWDAAPFTPILSEAGGRFTDKDGVAGAHGGSGISTNGVLHEEVLRVLRGSSREGT